MAEPDCGILSFKGTGITLYNEMFIGLSYAVAIKSPAIAGLFIATEIFQLIRANDSRVSTGKHFFFHFFLSAIGYAHIHCNIGNEAG